MRRGRVVLGAVGVAVVGWVVAVPLAGVSLRVRAGGGEPAVVHGVGFAMVVLAAVLAGVAAAVLLAVLERRTRRAGRWWVNIAGATLASSFAGPLRAADVATGMALAGLHLLVGVTLIVGFARTIRCSPPADGC
ncbi:DUF6069 family protein [Frankia sp. AgPm24]|uniref:DUF6069 family protein n=1 Tax=Frankia sp. AgPm24 TaxID=631128 RepID=UPI00200CCCCA|nr:DUF6069 family protein [Frankia sp. AgPm24]MCK9922055.1 DUF6069 family protein [Frankia sp. AgPm24]